MPIPKDPFWLPTSKSFSFLLVLPKQIYMIMAMFHKGPKKRKKKKKERQLRSQERERGSCFSNIVKFWERYKLISTSVCIWTPKSGGGGDQRKMYFFVIPNKDLDSWIASLFLGSSESQIFPWLRLNETRQPLVSLANIHENLWRWDGLNSSLSDFSKASLEIEVKLILTLVGPFSEFVSSLYCSPRSERASTHCWVNNSQTLPSKSSGGHGLHVAEKRTRKHTPLWALVGGDAAGSTALQGDVRAAWGGLGKASQTGGVTSNPRLPATGALAACAAWLASIHSLFPVRKG